MSFLFAAVILGQVAGNIAGRAADAVGADAASEPDPEAAVERLRVTLTAPGDPARMTAEQRAAEIAALVGSGLTQGGQLNDGQRQRLAALVAAEAGISEADARARIQRAETEARAPAHGVGLPIPHQAAARLGGGAHSPPSRCAPWRGPPNPHRAAARRGGAP